MYTRCTFVFAAIRKPQQPEKSQNYQFPVIIGFCGLYGMVV